MALKLFNEPKLQQPVMIASWPGIGNIGLVAVETMRVQIEAIKMGEIEPWDFLYPRKVVIRDGVLESLEFPACTFYYKDLPGHGVIMFVGEEQPTDGMRPYAEGQKAYQMANMVVDVAQKLGCRRIYTSGAAVSLSHHSLKPRVWIATSSEALNREMVAHPNTVLMGREESRTGAGSISGLNGLVLGVAKARSLEAVCFMGEIPDYLATAPLPYPRATRSVVELMSELLGFQADYSQLDEMATKVEEVIAGIYNNLPSDIRDHVEQRKTVRSRAEGITEDEGKWMKEHIEDLFKKGDRPDERAS